MPTKGFVISDLQTMFYTHRILVRVFVVYILLLLLAFTTHLRVLASSFLRFRDHTQGHDTVGRTPLD